MLVVVADHHPLFREVLRGLVAEVMPAACCLEACSVADVLDLLGAGHGVGLVLVDQGLPDGDGLGGLVRLCIAAPEIPVVWFSTLTNPALHFHALVCGAAGIVSKAMTKEQMIGVIARVAGRQAGGRGRPAAEAGERIDVLTLRERMVLDALVRGHSNKEIAYALQVSDTTVKVHVSSVLRKLRVHSRTQVVIKTRRIGETLSGAGLWPGATSAP